MKYKKNKKLYSKNPKFLARDFTKTKGLKLKKESWYALSVNMAKKLCLPRKTGMRRILATNTNKIIPYKICLEFDL